MRAYLTLLLLVLLAGCASHPAPSESYAVAADASPLGRRIQQLAADHPDGHSGFRLLPESTEAFTARSEMIRAAQLSLDVQYYIVHDGLTTRALIDELLQAADRGVRVRLLLDDTTSDGHDYRIATLAAHPNIQVRVFNPLHIGRSNAVTRTLGRLLHLSLQHRRMHNKLMLVDSSLAIVGGRNLGDEYFEADQAMNFTDIDLLGAGPVAEQLARSFDEYWNNQLSVPIQRFLWSQPKASRLDKARQELRDYLQQARQDNSKQYQRLMQYKQRPQLQQWLEELIWAPGEAMWDAPEKLLAEGVPAASLLLTAQLAPSMQAVSHELTLVSAYFVPTDSGVDYLADRADAGVVVRVLTNSLEATDVPAVHGGYAPYRERMLELGVRLFELRRQPEQEPSYSFLGESESSLHSKAAVFDQEKVFIGSLNFDPRSILWNSEVGILVESPELAREVHRLTLEGMSPAVSYEVRLEERGGQRQLVWIAEDGGRLRVIEKEPGGLWRRFNAWFSNVIGLEKML
ncbi:phospholipase D family protein [Stutzerimonas sp. R40042]|uniref:phospholipase D family protein n=1 Tax=Stutzerimonas TaxID=2901164 RepID=UPI00190B9F81|nr:MULTISPECIES: phospholipase D family protein [Stutzerimonas]MBK3873350.1 phospholipase D family protein [Stutzerimonas frequens]MBK3911619.1 phospholipase D family protein [Stutzerimonas frequens]MBK3930902.1 phospholipase D family protein [Stutzerimonas frequens]WAE62530.1 phospholipase D family protein [Stutzerimonas sp. R40042]